MLPTEDSNHDPNDQIRQQLDREFTCEHQEMSLVVKQQRNGLRYFRQCQRCGNTDPLRGADLPDEEKNSAIPFDKAIKDRWWRARSERASELYEKDRREEKEEFDRWYQDYLTTPEWRVKRDTVLKRAGFVCEGYLTNRASEVHHLTYVRVGREMLFDLVAVCEICHRKIHDLEPVKQDKEEEWDPSWDDDAPPF